MYIKNAFVLKNNPNIFGGSASVCLVKNINDIEAMQTITKQLNLPISVFLKQSDHLFEVRYFIAEGEEPICGHGTIVATKFLLDNGFIKNNEREVIFKPLYNNPKYGINIHNNYIKSYINNDFISICINTKSINKNLTKDKQKEIISAISNNNELFDIINIIEGEFDYTIEIIGKNEKLNALEVIKSIQPDFNKIEHITLSNGKLCRGIDIIIKNNNKNIINCEYISRIFLPLGANEEYKEDPACGSGTAYITQYLYETYNVKNEISFFQASKYGAFIKAKILENNKVLISGMCG